MAVKSYVYATITSLKAGQHFQFAPYGTTLLKCIIKERNLIVYTNIVTGGVRRFKDLVVVDKKKQTCSIRFIKIIDHFLEEYYQNRKDIEDLPF